MTLPKKNRQSIVVLGETYHWTRGRSPENMWITIQHGSGQGALIRMDAVGMPMPSDIAEAIRFAQKHGWQPTQGGEPFYLGFTDRKNHPRLVVRQDHERPYWQELELDCHDAD